jgi:protochlorophyllide reductase
MLLSNIIVLVTVAITDAYSIHKPILSNVLQSSSQTALSASSRREILKDSLVTTASILLGQPMISSALMDENPKTILLTGSNSGIGFEASKLLLDAGHTLILPCRNFDKAVATAQRLDSEKTNRVIPAECNLADLSSIEKFSKELPSILSSGKKLDIMCLNAGIARATSATDVARTQDGFELTVGTNHLGHFYFNSLMLPFLDSKARIVVTASSVHDPQSPGGAQGQTATLGDLSGLERDGANFEMVDGGPFNADKAYKDSKVRVLYLLAHPLSCSTLLNGTQLCNVLFFRELQKRLSISPDTQGISVNAFTPGLIVSTGLFRDQPKLFTKVSGIVNACFPRTNF